VTGYWPEAHLLNRSLKETMPSRVLAIGLDGFEITLAERFMSEGLMPHFARIADRSLRARLDHGADKFSGLAWEHVSVGRAPSDGARWSAVTFDKDRYTARQENSTYRPFLADLPLRSVVADLPYCRLAGAPDVQGFTGWGAHDPGVDPGSRPESLLAEIEQRFGPYPAPEWIYGFVWPSPERTRRASEALTRAVNVRTEVTRWLLGERLPDWDLAIVVASETHSAIEPLWHGVDASHPLHGLPSAAPAAAGLRDVYGAIDNFIGTLADAFPDATLVLFAMHGMGINDADVPVMALLPELLHRHAFGRPHMKQAHWPSRLSDGTPLLGEDDSWEQALADIVPMGNEAAARSGLRGLLDRLSPRRRPAHAPLDNHDPAEMAWMPTTRYQSFWPAMRVFALPSFYDGRIRVNLAGRESRGIVQPGEYHSTLDALTKVLEECRDAITGEPAVAQIIRHEGDPADVGPSQSDMSIFWRGCALGLTHPSLGTIGPVPWRRTGGHSGAHGFVHVSGQGIREGDAAPASSFDVVPTLIALTGAAPLPNLSGRVLPALAYRGEDLAARRP
jgi:predicted AlkP superfamily phosphohydrolase/phosphomutase